jgi:hypothetical protein
VLTQVRALEPVVIADLDILLTALYVALADRIIPAVHRPRPGAGAADERHTCLGTLTVT